jgi:hypothetical protein
MGTEIGPIRKSSITVLTGKGFLSSMRSDVSLEEPGAGEGLSTERALTGERMGSDVHLEGSQRHVDLVTELTDE